MTEWVLLGVAVLLIAANGLFVAAEFSFVTADRSVVEQLAERGDRRAAGLLAGVKSLSTQLSGAQLGITVTSLIVGYLAEPSLAALLHGPLGMTGLSDAAATGAAIAVALIVATTTQMVFGELVPKNWAIAQPIRVGRAVSSFQRGFSFAAKPLIAFLNGMANTIVRALGIEPVEELASARTPGELASMASRSASSGTLGESTARLLTRSIEFGDRRASDVMTPRPQVEFILAEQTAADVLDRAASSGHARFPVLGRSVDEVVGIVHFKHALAVPREERTHRLVGSIMHDLPPVAASMELDNVLDNLRQSGPQMALVVDEYGGTAGVVTMENLIEEIVGDIKDEQDRPTGKVRALGDDEWSLSGMLRPDEVEGVTGVQLPAAADSDTLGGLVTELVGRLAEVGDVIRTEAKDRNDVDEDGVPRPVQVEVEVTRLDGYRVAGVRLSLGADDHDEGDRGEEDRGG